MIYIMHRRMYRSLHALKRVIRTNELCEQIALGKAFNSPICKLLPLYNIWLYRFNTVTFFSK